MADAVLIAAQAGRALAEAARRAGLRPYVADLFGDADTLAAAEAYRPLPGRFGTPPAADATVAALDHLAVAAGRPIGLILGSGFEDAPDLIGRLAARHRLIGASAETVSTLKAPLAFARPFDPIEVLALAEGNQQLAQHMCRLRGCFGGALSARFGAGAWGSLLEIDSHADGELLLRSWVEEHTATRVADVECT